MSPIFVLIFIALAILFIALYKSDFGLLMFSGFIFIMCGLSIMNNGIIELEPQLNWGVGILITFIGIYIIIKSAVDLIPMKRKKKLDNEVR